MAYNKKTWVTGETIEASALNNMEDGIEAGQNDDLEKEVEQNTEDIATNKASIEQNASDIATNKASIEQNASDIATNKASIEQNASDIATNKANISQNASDIATNKANISQNASDIATNKTNISQNTSDIEEINSALADKIEMQTGTYTLSSGELPASSYVDISVSFSKAFSSAPAVISTLTSGTSSNYGYVTLIAYNSSTSGFTLRVVNSSTSASLQPAVRWMAFGQIASSNTTAIPQGKPDDQTEAGPVEEIEP